MLLEGSCTFALSMNDMVRGCRFIIRNNVNTARHSTHSYLPLFARIAREKVTGLIGSAIIHFDKREDVPLFLDFDLG